MQGVGHSSGLKVIAVIGVSAMLGDGPAWAPSSTPHLPSTPGVAALLRPCKTPGRTIWGSTVLARGKQTSALHVPFPCLQSLEGNISKSSQIPLPSVASTVFPFGQEPAWGDIYCWRNRNCSRLFADCHLPGTQRLGRCRGCAWSELVSGMQPGRREEPQCSCLLCTRDRAWFVFVWSRSRFRIHSDFPEDITSACGMCPPSKMPTRKMNSLSRSLFLCFS